MKISEPDSSQWNDKKNKKLQCRKFRFGLKKKHSAMAKTDKIICGVSTAGDWNCSNSAEQYHVQDELVGLAGI